MLKHMRPKVSNASFQYFLKPHIGETFHLYVLTCVSVMGGWNVATLQPASQTTYGLYYGLPRTHVSL